ncbi:hypothetical protein BWO91_16190 [Plantibacter flavus]|nr:hypothetical protein BWO91_16190 [Plantibacter flavus]
MIDLCTTLFTGAPDPVGSRSARCRTNRTRASGLDGWSAAVDHQRPADGSHLELFRTSRAGQEVGVPCWCAIGANHSYADWLAAGRPDPRRPMGSRRHLPPTER